MGVIYLLKSSLVLSAVVDVGINWCIDKWELCHYQLTKANTKGYNSFEYSGIRCPSLHAMLSTPGMTNQIRKIVRMYQCNDLPLNSRYTRVSGGLDIRDRKSLLKQVSDFQFNRAKKIITHNLENTEISSRSEMTVKYADWPKTLYLPHITNKLTLIYNYPCQSYMIERSTWEEMKAGIQGGCTGNHSYNNNYRENHVA